MSARRPLPIPEAIREKLMTLAEETGQNWIGIANEILARGVIEMMSGRTVASLDARLKGMAVVVEALVSCHEVGIQFTRSGFVVHSGDDTDFAATLAECMIASKIKTEMEKEF